MAATQLTVRHRRTGAAGLTPYNLPMEASLQYLQTLQGLPAYSLVLGLLVACGIGAPMNEDIVLLIASALTLSGVMDPVLLILVAWVGLIVGDALVFHWGHRYGTRMLRSGLVSRIVPDGRLQSLQARILRGGPVYIFVIRFLPGIRTALFFAAGSLKLPYRHLFIFDGAAALIELPLLVYGVRFVGGRWQEILRYIERFQTGFVVALLALFGAWMLRRWYKRRTLTKGEIDEA
jgi:membrane protein DedA with SNARE-associated domain